MKLYHFYVLFCNNRGILSLIINTLLFIYIMCWLNQHKVNIKLWILLTPNTSCVILYNYVTPPPISLLSEWTQRTLNTTTNWCIVPFLRLIIISIWLCLRSVYLVTSGITHSNYTGSALWRIWASVVSDMSVTRAQIAWKVSTLSTDAFLHAPRGFSVSTLVKGMSCNPHINCKRHAGFPGI